MLLSVPRERLDIGSSWGMSHIRILQPCNDIGKVHQCSLRDRPLFQHPISLDKPQQSEKLNESSFILQPVNHKTTKKEPAVFSGLLF